MVVATGLLRGVYLLPGLKAELRVVFITLDVCYCLAVAFSFPVRGGCFVLVLGLGLWCGCSVSPVISLVFGIL